MSVSGSFVVDVFLPRAFSCKNLLLSNQLSAPMIEIILQQVPPSSISHQQVLVPVEPITAYSATLPGAFSR